MAEHQNIRTSTWDPSRNLTTDAEVAAYLQAALEDGDASLVAAALGDIARAQGMTRVPITCKPRPGR